MGPNLFFKIKKKIQIKRQLKRQNNDNWLLSLKSNTQSDTILTSYWSPGQRRAKPARPVSKQFGSETQSQFLFFTNLHWHIYKTQCQAFVKTHVISSGDPLWAQLLLGIQSISVREDIPCWDDGRGARQADKAVSSMKSPVKSWDCEIDECAFHQSHGWYQGWDR